MVTYGGGGSVILCEMKNLRCEKAGPPSASAPSTCPRRASTVGLRSHALKMTMIKKGTDREGFLPRSVSPSDEVVSYDTNFSGLVSGEFDGDRGLDRYRPPVNAIRLVAPPAHGFHGGSLQPLRPAQRMQVNDRAVAADGDAKDD